MFETYKHSIVRLEGFSKKMAKKLDINDGIKDTVSTLKFPNNLLEKQMI